MPYQGLKEFPNQQIGGMKGGTLSLSIPLSSLTLLVRWSPESLGK